MKTYFPNLNALRCIAAFLVIIFHIELYKNFFHLSNLSNIPFFKIIGKLGVVLFFVLSGFLISVLLLKEKDKLGKILYKDFYMRRVLRIWPVYFLILFLGFFVFPNFSFWNIPSSMFHPVSENFWIKLLLYIIILPNLSVALFKEVANVSQSWSLGTEEQFYLIWPLFIDKCRKFLLPGMIGIILFYLGFKVLLGKLAIYDIIWQHLFNFWYLFKVDCMAIGGIFAVIYYDKYHAVTKFLFNKVVFLSVVILTLSFLGFGLKFGFFHYDVYAILFGVIIFNLACNERYKNLLEYKILNYLGSISYGMYMYHLIALQIAIRCGIFFKNNLIIYILTFALTILFSGISYRYFEKYFLKFKRSHI
ncbi:Peptidoglycan/LPS O-acetylase OafA/YrhL, contains acyltransferase and SGNH-hydrolase domains [Flavobacterium fryxellicola]|uniref:acyltransferase family protein n=1 Tax=Flavobacterium fryxellicola TaxID=249352 RepID=UPI00091F2D91|nr:acyltransferase [Flavobacterium fryxellicola]SHN69465.1 Peptidoglycan/LPS O-acetylase OafA/YrhL, contains acyltransferase and SGNH-hydrolase domains [Flavobacterium fryxellicola]